MSDALQLGLYGSMLLAGIAGSLHCIGMCGPILVAFSQTFERARLASGTERPGRLRSSIEFTCYHAGRIWTYGALGFLAGLAGDGLRSGAGMLGWQRGAALLMALGVLAGGVVLSGWLPAGWTRTLIDGCAIGRIREWPWFRGLLENPGAVSRFLLGVVMGLLPCGMVYAMLVAVAAFATPWHSALGMVVFGLGTVPSLAAVLLASGAIPARLRLQGTRITAIALILAGAVMLGRALAVSPDADHSHHAPASATQDHTTH